MKKTKLLFNEDRRNNLPRTFKGWLESAGDRNWYFKEYDFDLDDKFDESNFNSYEEEFETKEEYEDALEDWRMEKFIEYYGNIYNSWIQKYKRYKFPLVLFRVVQLKAKSISNIANIYVQKEFKKGVGVYWTDGYNPYGLGAFWGKGGKEFTLKSVVTESDIDWVETIKANMHPFIGKDESEIRLIKGTKIHLIGIAEGLTVNEKDFEELDVIVKA